MDKLFDSLTKALESSNPTATFVILAVAVLVNLKAILEFFERRTNRRDDFIKESLKLDFISGTEKAFFEEELRFLLFKRLTGISAHKALREKIKDLVERSGGELQTPQFSRARAHLRMKAGRLNVEIRRWENFEWVLNWLLATAISLIAIGMFMSAALLRPFVLSQALTIMAMGVVSFLFALFLVLQTVPVSVARRLAPIIERLESSVSGDDA